MNPAAAANPRASSNSRARSIIVVAALLRDVLPTKDDG
jgi:hypothetical protein